MRDVNISDAFVVALYFGSTFLIYIIAIGM